MSQNWTFGSRSWHPISISFPALSICVRTWILTQDSEPHDSHRLNPISNSSPTIRPPVTGQWAAMWSLYPVRGRPPHHQAFFRMPICMLPEIGVPPNHPFRDGIWPYFYHPASWGYRGTPIYGNSHVFFKERQLVLLQVQAGILVGKDWHGHLTTDWPQLRFWRL